MKKDNNDPENLTWCHLKVNPLGQVTAVVGIRSLNVSPVRELVCTGPILYALVLGKTLGMKQEV